jgi:hypothetical protein
MKKGALGLSVRFSWKLVGYRFLPNQLEPARLGILFPCYGLCSSVGVQPMLHPDVMAPILAQYVVVHRVGNCSL